MPGVAAKSGCAAASFRVGFAPPARLPFAFRFTGSPGLVDIEEERGPGVQALGISDEVGRASDERGPGQAEGPDVEGHAGLELVEQGLGGHPDGAVTELSLEK